MPYEAEQRGEGYILQSVLRSVLFMCVKNVQLNKNQMIINT